MTCSLACVATATTTRKPSPRKRLSPTLNPSRSPRPSRKPPCRPTRTRRCEHGPRVSHAALKKVLVEEQSTLLDGVRRSGSDAIAVVVADADAHAAPYESAIDAAFDEIIEAVGGDADTRQAGYEQLRSVALDPVRSRLLEVAEHTDDADELSDTVRGLYRESRSRVCRWRPLRRCQR